MKFFISIGWLIICVLTVIPILIWSSVMPLSIRFASLGTSGSSIGQLLGITGMVLFSIAMIISTRLKIFDSLFGGLNRAYIVHHQVGGIAFILLMIHPLTLAIPYIMTSLQSAALFLLPGQDWVVNFGIAGLISLMGLLIFTYYIDLPYELWRFTHKFMGIAFLFGVIHTFFIPSDISTYPTLRIYIFILMSAGMAGYLYRTVLGRWLVPRLPYTIYSLTKKGDGILELVLTPDTPNCLDFSPGQFIFIQLIGHGFSQETHPFSLSSAPTSKGFAITAKILGDFTEKLETVPSGTKARIEGPFGRFSPAYVPSQSYIWIAGGIGITPFISMARALHTDTQIDLYYVVRTETEAVFLPELLVIAKKFPSLKIIPWYTKIQGHLTGELIQKYSQNLVQRHIFLCGPPAMMKSTKTELRRIGVTSSNIHSEEFNIN